MKKVFGWTRSKRLGRSKWLLVLPAVVLAAKAWATPPLGFVLNQILASGFAADGISEHMQINKNPDGTVTPWQLVLQVQGDTDYYSQHLVLCCRHGYSVAEHRACADARLTDDENGDDPGNLPFSSNTA